ncbi:hypothetical protein [Chryseobacterium luquanense]|uniref:Uncharacterized protein n=1 Tax=Chryseobacterium luquanense TaxID=2983766 RepID=A0ABT3XYN2_9FLAO|nr:hypothetical protein [Chryseobacterium luquanense]MCX8530970.1 hypothetical protein [Chryseobacterium luquanense]
MKSKINFESFLIIYFATFMLSIIFPFVIIDLSKDILIEFNLIKILKICLLLFSLIFVWSFFLKIHTKIKITNDKIEFNKLFKSSKYEFNDLSYYVERNEPARFKNYQAIFLIQNNKIIERISEFDYSNYEEIKNHLNLPKKQNYKLKTIDFLKILLKI